MNRILLHRTTDKGNTRYYKIELFCTLFGEFIVERIYGNRCFKKPTGIMKTYHETMEDAKNMYYKLVQQKIKKGYKE